MFDVRFRSARFEETVATFAYKSEARQFRDAYYLQLVDAFGRRNLPFPSDASLPIVKVGK